jgi:fatty acid/phospholipid biosynthesis enzyme
VYHPDDVSIDEIREWSAEQIGVFMMDNNFPDYGSTFEQNDINGELLLEISHLLLKEMGVSSAGHRQKIINIVSNLTKCCINRNVHSNVSLKIIFNSRLF